MQHARKALSRARRLVVKVGSSLLTAGGQGLDETFLGKLASEIGALRAGGKEVLLVTSGAVAAGVSRLGIARPTDIPTKQAAAAVGQSRLMHAYERHFEPRGVGIAQVLLTHDDLANRRRYLNARATLQTVLSLGVLPILNENDTVAVREIKFGDNDNLSSLVATLMSAEGLIILSDIEGLFTADPRTSPDAELLPFVERIDGRIELLAGGTASRTGTGGMATKLQAARKATALGITTVIADGRAPRVLERLVDGEMLGTLFAPAADRLAARKHWIAYTLKVSGQVQLDEGATLAVQQRGKSLLPIGVRGVEGRFRRGDCISLCDPQGAEFARGLSMYDANEVRQLCGKPSSEIELTLGYYYGEEIVHRDDLVLLDTSA